MFDVTHVITTIDRGGAEKHLLQLASAQVAKGLRVRVIYLKGSGELIGDFESSGCSVVTQLSNKNVLLQILELRKILKGDCRVIHAHLPRAELLSAISSSTKFVVSRHNAEKFFPGAPDSLSRLLSRYVALNAYACIGISMAVKEFLLQSKEWPSTPEVTVIHYGVHGRPLNLTVTKTQLLQNLGIPASSKVIGTIARVVPQKDYPTLLRAFKIVNKRYPDSFLVSLGEGFLQTEMNELAIELGISERARWIGKVENVDNYLQLFDCFVLTSLYEGFGLVLLEAANAGLPIVASEISAIPEVLGSDYKYLAHPGAYEQFANLIVKSLNEKSSPELAKFNQKIMDKFSVDVMLQSTLATYGR
jgi:glycosyltransferase involved in cell wall biosynthesis